MEKIFTKDFLRFLLGFIGLIVATLLILFLLEGQVAPIDGSSSEVQTLPATTTE